MTLLVFGMDGAVKEYVEEGVERGLMPNMETVLKEGCFGELRSSHPPITIPAWPSMFSGLHPDRFSTFHVTEMDEDYSTSTIHNSRWRDDQVWNQVDGSFGLLAIPGLVPPYPVDGYMVTGFPLVNDPETYPDGFVDVSDLDFKRKNQRTTREGRRQDFFHNFQERAELFDGIDREVDVRIEVYQLTDASVHRAVDMDQVMEAYEAVDEVLGRRMEEYDDVMVVSDHGFQHVDTMFYTNAFLEESGYLKRAESGGGSTGLVQRITDFAAPLAETRLRPLLKYVNDALKTKASVDFSPKGFDPELVDFASSEAFSYRGGANNYGSVTVNDDRFDSGPVQDRRSKAEEIAEKLSSEGCVDEVWLREELYDEPEEMPDVVFKVAEDTGVGVSLFSKAEFGTDTYVHSETGIVGALGPSFREGKVSGQLADVTPTVAEYLGQDVDCDGTSLNLFSEGFEPSEPEGDELSGVEV